MLETPFAIKEVLRTFPYMMLLHPKADPSGDIEIYLVRFFFPVETSLLTKICWEILTWSSDTAGESPTECLSSLFLLYPTLSFPPLFSLCKISVLTLPLLSAPLQYKPVGFSILPTTVTHCVGMEGKKGKCRRTAFFSLTLVITLSSFLEVNSNSFRGWNYDTSQEKMAKWTKSIQK